jgi:hypothetical protein
MEFFENRRHFRLRDYFDVNWKINGNDSAGLGTVLNISASGVLLQTENPIKPFDQCVIEIAPQGKESPFAPKQGKIVWFKRINDEGSKYQCGVEFLRDAGLMDKSFKDWLDERMSSMSETTNVNILNNYVV